MTDFPSPRPGGLAGVFSSAGLPTGLKISYWIWFLGGIFGLLGGLMGMMGSLVLFAAAPAIAVPVLVLMLLAAVVGAAQVVFALKLKERMHWPRIALTILTGVTLLLAVFSAVAGMGQAGNWLGVAVSLLATVLLWVPKSQAWLAGPGTRGTAGGIPPANDP